MPPAKKSSTRSRGSIFYGANEYLEELKKKLNEEVEVNASKQMLDMNGKPQTTGDKMLTQQVTNENRSLMTGRLFPTANKPEEEDYKKDPHLRSQVAFLFQKLTGDQCQYMWNFLTFIFFLELVLICVYCGILAALGGPDKMDWSTYLGITIPWGFVTAYINVQHIYVDHDVMHGATYPPYDWQKYITHPLSDFWSLPWDEFILEHNRHHASTVDLLLQGEFGWDPEMLQYKFAKVGYNDDTGKTNWLLTLLVFPLCPFVHFIGINDTGSLFAVEWWFAFPDEGAGGKCAKSTFEKWIPVRLSHNRFVWFLWACVWLLGTFPFGRPLSEGWRFVIPVTCAFRAGFGTAWMFITNFTHSPQWNHFLAHGDPDRSMPCIHAVMAFILGGRHRWNEMLFHDVHHAFPNAVGTMSQRGRFHGWEKVHDAAAVVMQRGIWKPVDSKLARDVDKETKMQSMQKKRSIMIQKKDKKSATGK